MAAAYLYRMSGGYGHTTIDITIDHTANTFVLAFSDGWMGRDALEKIRIVGNVCEKTATHMRLVSINAGEGDAEILHLPELLDFEIGDEEYECMVMANGGQVNKDGRYDTIIVLDFARDVEGAGKAWRRMVERSIVKGTRT